MGIKGEQDFLRNPLAQEMAIEAYLLKTERALGNKGILAYAGQTIDGIKGNIALTEGRLLAAAHRQGTGNVALYLDHLKRHNWISDPSTFPKGQLGHKLPSRGDPAEDIRRHLPPSSLITVGDRALVSGRL